ncbi:protocatechuate 3,4-dioxygenase subunit beta [Paraburkholderia nemoris]|uniref:protocatechuate 3,4-dioxygenase subunit beta n=1 Tax=Paraburkholderia nemoris TaxID=2793076 RepID=UPI0038BCBF45
MKLAQYRKPYWDSQPELDYRKYTSTTLRAPRQPLVIVPQTLSDISGPAFGYDEINPTDSDLIHQHIGEPLGERIIVSGRILNENRRPVPYALVELWQANAAGRYRHRVDQHDAPLDPNFSGAGRVITDSEGRFRFLTIKPGCYPWGNHYNGWRPAHIHFSVFGEAFLQRLVTQMYFPGDPLLAFDPIYNSIADENARRRMLCTFDWETTVPDFALGFKFDIVLRGRDATPME